MAPPSTQIQSSFLLMSQLDEAGDAETDNEEAEVVILKSFLGGRIFGELTEHCG
ncbi:MAG: hypothetical protein KA368_01575 [Acidobacteria bacterium]|nr:hypothetical protein [Acidobacteriota bacterium]